MAARDDSAPAKRRKLNSDLPEQIVGTEHRSSLLNRPISPPIPGRKIQVPPNAVPTPTWGFGGITRGTPTPTSPNPAAQRDTSMESDGLRKEHVEYVSAPVQLTNIQDLAPHQNIDAIGLKDLLGNPLIKECWNFNYLHDVDYVMKHFDEDVRDLVKVKFIHGFWKNEDENRIRLLEAAERYPNVQLISAYIPDPFGTHHSKMLVLFHHDNTAQLVIHTSNMIARDWGNMTQAVWQSPILPLISKADVVSPPDQANAKTHPIGSGERFKVDFIRYIKAYGTRLKTLATLLIDYDFSAIRAAFIGSAPSRQKPAAAQPFTQTSFGWLGLQEVLSTIPIKDNPDAVSPPHIVIQISSIATLGAVPTWLTCLQNALTRSAVQPSKPAKASTFFEQHDSSSQRPSKNLQKPNFSIIFPTPDEIRTSLDGYGSGASIHIKLQSQQQQKQQEYLHPLFCHWKPTSVPKGTERRREAFRGPAAPHIKTYIRFSDQDHKTIDWAMVTSANLSKQAWGDVVNKKDEIWIQSWEAGVVVWPGLLSKPDTEEAIMVPVFGKDMPGPKDLPDFEEKGDSGEKQSKTVVGFRMPYDLPLTPYGADDEPWCATRQYSAPDWKGMAWAGYGR